MVIRHPLQAFDPRNFTAAGSDPARAAGGPWSFDPAALAGARAFRATRHEPLAFLPAPLPPAAGDQLVTLDELVSFVQRPVRAFLRQRLGVSAQRDEDEIDDALPIELDGLARWGVGQRLLDALIAGAEPRAAALAEIARGTLPPGALGRPLLAELWPDVQAIAAAVHSHGAAGDPRSEQTNVALPDGVRLTGTVSGVYGHTSAVGQLLATGSAPTPGRVGPAAGADRRQPGDPVRGGHDRPRRAARLDPGDPHPAARQHRQACAPQRRSPSSRRWWRCAPRACARRCRCPCRTGHAYAEAALQTGEDPVAAALKRWRSGWFNDRFIEGEEDEPEHRLALGPELELERLAALATAIWRPLLAREVVGG